MTAARPLNPSAADPRVLLPLNKREHTQETLADGTILISYRDPPLGAPLIELPDEIEEHSAQTWKADKPSAPKSEGLDRWNGPLGPRNSRKRA